MGSKSALVSKILTILQPRIVSLVSEAFNAQQAQAAALAEQQRLEQIRIQEIAERREQVRLEQLRVEQQRQEQLRLEKLRIEQQRQEQIRLEEQRRQQQLLLQQQSSSSSSSSSLGSLFGTGHEVKVEVPGTFLEEYTIGKK